ncbi:MAG: arginine--tRNA ligase [Candidatus Omnitrophica bacterium]|nr:arginine--tRNA ligase [Candidatus Omnitrophota bacterium]
MTRPPFPTPPIPPTSAADPADELLPELTGLLHAVVQARAPSAPSDQHRWDVPKDPSFGELSSSVAFRLAGLLRQPPGTVAEQLAIDLEKRVRQGRLAGVVDRCEVKSGYINVFLSQQGLARIVARILHEKRRFGEGVLGQGRSVLIEFVSANPTGPLSVAHGRQAAVGDALARLLRAQGYRVSAEYYLNDEGRQIELLGRSLRLRCLERLGHPEPLPEDAYHGRYLLDTAEACLKRYGPELAQQPESASLPVFMKFGMEHQLQVIKDDLVRFGLTFDEWTSQEWLRLSGRVDQSLDALRQQGALFETDGATWFASTKYGDDKDRVVRKQSGELTYLAPDIAYHQWKFQRGYDQLVNLWGPDHHGYIARVKAALTALGLPAERMTIRIVQLVTLSRGGGPVPMSKRQGEFVTFREIMDEVGVDATRFFYLMRTMDSHLDFDLELAKSQSQENPVYYVQYAHARIWSILARFRQQVPFSGRREPVDLSLLVEPEERLLMRQLFLFPIAVQICAQALEPHGLSVYLQRLAEIFHVFYTKHRVVTDNLPRSCARVRLVRATRWVLANGLSLLGVSAPKRM